MILMITGCKGKWYDDFFDSKCINLGKCCCTSSCYRKIGFRKKGSNICLCNPLDRLKIFHVLEFLFERSIELSETDDPFEIAMIRKLFSDLWKDDLRSLTSTDHKYMWKLRFPGYRICFWVYFFCVCEYWMDDLSDDDGFPFFEIWFCFLKAKKYSIRNHTKNPIRSPRNRIRFVYIKVYIHRPCSETNSHWSRSTFWKNTDFWMSIFLYLSDYSTCCEYSFYENNRVKKHLKGPCTRKFQCWNRKKSDSFFFCIFFLSWRVSSYPYKISLCKNIFLNEIFYEGNNRLDMSAGSTSYKDDFFILRKFFYYFLIHDRY